MIRFLPVFFLCVSFLSVSLMGQEPMKLGKVQPATIDTVTSKDGGYLEFVDVAVGDFVEKNQLLMKLDHDRELHTYLTAKLRAEDRAGIEIAEGGLREKNANLSHIQDRFRRRQVVEEEVEKAKGQAQVARGRLSQAKMQLEMNKLAFGLAERMLENRYIRASMSGTVIEISKPRGARLNQGDPVLTIADLENLSSDATVTQESLEKLSIGSSIPVRLAGSESLRYARIDSINPVEGAKNGEHSVRLVFENLKPDSPLAALSLEALLPEGVTQAPPQTPTPEPATEEKK